MVVRLWRTQVDRARMDGASGTSRRADEGNWLATALSTRVRMRVLARALPTRLDVDHLIR